MRRGDLCLAALVAATSLAAASFASAAPARQAASAGAAPLRLTVVFTGDVSGYLEPCG